MITSGLALARSVASARMRSIFAPLHRTSRSTSRRPSVSSAARKLPIRACPCASPAVPIRTPTCRRCCARAASFDDLVGAGEQRRRDFEAERPGRREIDDKLEPGRLRDWQVYGLGTLENASGIDAGLAMRIRQAGAIAHQP